jgi:hypothetical protein
MTQHAGQWWALLLVAHTRRQLAVNGCTVQVPDNIICVPTDATAEGANQKHVTLLAEVLCAGKCQRCLLHCWLDLLAS